MSTNGTLNSSSILDFKAEFLKKKQEFQSKLKNNVSHSKTEIRSTPLEANLKCQIPVSSKTSSKNKKSFKNNLDNNNHNKEDDERLELSKKKLVEKSRLYESLRKEFPRAKEDDDCLVDFEKKCQEKYESDEDYIDSSGHLEDNKWVEYTDSLGRVRKCLPEDLEEYIRRDNELKCDEIDPTSEETCAQSSWDFSSAELKNVHYEDLRQNEIRTHGVGYYSFSVDQAEREKQQAQLAEMHQQTERNRVKREEIKAKRKALLQKRLERVRVNRGLPPASETTENNTDNDDLKIVSSCNDSNLPEMQQTTGSHLEPESSELPNRKRPIQQRPHVREWDRGKSFKLLTQEDYVNKEREKRNSEFAPPSFYNK